MNMAPFFFTGDLLWMILGSIYAFSVAVLALGIIGSWKIYSKAGEHGWAAIIPFYESYVMHKITWGQGWFFLIPVVLSALSQISGIGSLFTLLGLLFYAMTMYKLSLSFGHGIGYAVGLFFLGPVFKLILGFGRSTYFGVPLDGMSYDDIRNMFGGFSSKNMKYRK